MIEKDIIQDLLNRASLDLTDTEVMDSLVKQLIRHQLSPHLNKIFGENTRLNSEKIPSMDHAFMQRFLDVSRKIIYDSRLQDTIYWVKTKQYGHTWIRSEKSLKTYPLKYIFVLRKDHYSKYTINIHAGREHEEDTLLIIISDINYDPLYPDENNDFLHIAEFTISTERLFESLPVIFKNLEKASKTGFLDFDLLDPEGRTEDEKQEREAEEIEEDEVDEDEINSY